MNADKDVVVYTASDEVSAELAVAVKQPADATLANLAGRWTAFFLASDPGAPWWQRLTIDFQANGDYVGSTVNNSGQQQNNSGTVPSISASGVIEGLQSPANRIAMNVSKTVMVGTDTWTEDNPGTAELCVWTKMAASYSQVDLAGTWSIHIIDSGSGSPWWQRALSTIDAGGAFTSMTLENDGDTDTITGVLHLAADGIITIDGAPLFRGVLDAGKTVLVWTNTQDGGASEMGVGVKLLR
jgi:hypothetical protein